MNCPSCGTKDYYEGIMNGPNCINSGCVHFKGAIKKEHAERNDKSNLWIDAFEKKEKHPFAHYVIPINDSIAANYFDYIGIWKETEETIEISMRGSINSPVFEKSFAKNLYFYLIEYTLPFRETELASGAKSILLDFENSEEDKRTLNSIITNVVVALNLKPKEYKSAIISELGENIWVR